MGRVVVVGSSNTDMTVRVPTIPAPGETVLGDGFQITAGGKGANQAIAASRAGAAVVFVTALGADDLGDRALENFAGAGIDVDLIFNGSLAAALVEGQSPRDALRFANAAAALSVTRGGAQASAPRRAEIEAFLQEHASKSTRP